MELYYGCRTEAEQCYKEEMEDAKQNGVLSNYHVAYSRKEGVPKVCQLTYIILLKLETVTTTNRQKSGWLVYFVTNVKYAARLSVYTVT